MNSEQGVKKSINPESDPELFDDSDCRPENAYPKDGQLDKLLPDYLKQALSSANEKAVPSGA